MKSHAAATRTRRKTADDSAQHAPAGDNAVAIVPPNYGIEFVDRGLAVNAEPVLQGEFAPVQRTVPDPISRGAKTGLPDNLRSGIESLSGMSMDNVEVHYKSSRPAQLNALAYAQGSEIHVAAGQERHLPHEAWHVVQQAQGRVRPTMQMKGGVPVNDDQRLEREADVMGQKALQTNSESRVEDVLSTQADMRTTELALHAAQGEEHVPGGRKLPDIHTMQLVSAPSAQEEKKESQSEADAPIPATVPSLLAPDKKLTQGEGVIGAISKEATGTGGHAWVATEYLPQDDDKRKNAVMHLTATGGKGDSASGGSGGSGGSVGSDNRSVKTSGRVQSGAVSNAEDSGSLVHSKSTKINVGSAEPTTFKSSIEIKIDKAAEDSRLQNLQKKTISTWDITDHQGEAALAKADSMAAKAREGKYMYAFSGRSISFTKTGMNCARFAEQVINAAGIRASAGWIIKTPSELATGKKAGFR